MKEAICIEDTNESLQQHIEHEVLHNHQFVDANARNNFKHEEVTVPVIKCTCRHNHCRIRNAMTNDDLTEKECPYCNAIET